MASDFVNAALEKMNDERGKRNQQVGSRYAGDKSGMDQTNCITFVTRVLSCAYEKVRKNEVASDIKKLSAKGTDIGKYLVTARKWKALYWNPDVHRPSDGDAEHPSSYKAAVAKNEYYGIPLSGFIINYNPTPVPRGKKGTVKEMNAMSRFNTVPFAVGIARGGYHTFLVSYGAIWEVHWSGAADSLYEVSDFSKYTWKSGVVIMP